MLTDLLADYAVPTSRYDELLSAPGLPREHWDAFLRALAARGSLEIGDSLAIVEREVRENGITYNVYADPQGMDRPWEVDPLPLLLSAQEWQAIEEGVTQRAELLNRVLADIYGPQELLKSGAVPPAVVFGHSGYLSPAQGIRPPGGRHLFHYAADLARSPDGRWWVVSDRTQAPSGAGYALENRLVMPRAISIAGTTTTAAPYSADSPADRSPVISPASRATTTPTTTWTRTTRQGETLGSLSRRACASCRVSALKGAESAPPSSGSQASERSGRPDIWGTLGWAAVGKPRDYTW